VAEVEAPGKPAPPLSRGSLARLAAAALVVGLGLAGLWQAGVLFQRDDATTTGAGGEIVGSAAKPHKMIVPQPGWAEHRARENWWDDFTFITRAILDETGVAPGDIRAVACSAIGPCMLPVDTAGEPLMNAVLYGVDGRAAREVAELTARIGEDVLLDRCGNALTSQSVGPKILWLKRNRPEVYEKTAGILTSTSYLVFRLTGAYVVDHYTAANFSPLYIVDKLEWSSELADDIIGLEKLPRLVWSSEIAGGITAQAARETGLAEGTPVTAGTRARRRACAASSGPFGDGLGCRRPRRS